MALKSCDSLEVEAAKCSKCTDLFGAGVNTPGGAAAPGDERVEAYMPSNVSLWLAWLHFETCQKQNVFTLNVIQFNSIQSVYCHMHKRDVLSCTMKLGDVM